LNKPEDTLAICVWVNQWCVETVYAKMSEINSGAYMIEHLGPCRM
jgi:hypothetical protein